MLPNALEILKNNIKKKYPDLFLISKKTLGVCMVISPESIHGILY